MLRGHPNRPSEAELAALADGSLTGERRSRVEAMVVASAELQELVRQQRVAIDLVQRAAVPAPSALRSRLVSSTPKARRRPMVFAPALASVVAVVVVVAVVLATVGSSAPSVAQAAMVASRPATAAAPAGNTGPLLPHVRAAGLPYPYWEDRFGWRATGIRRDRIAGRAMTTVFYRRGAERIGYTIVSGPALGTPDGARTSVRNGVRTLLFSTGGRTAVTWLRHGHTCVLSGADVPGTVLRSLAAWRAAGRIPY